MEELLKEFLKDGKNEIFALKGQLLHVFKKKTSDGSSEYFEASIKVVRAYGESEYQQGYNLYNVIVPSGSEITEKQLSQLIKEEVFVILGVKNSVKNIDGKESKFKVNNVSYFVEEIEISKVLSGKVKPSASANQALSKVPVEEAS